MSYQPHTSEDVGRMLNALGLDDVERLFDPIPAELRAPADPELVRLAEVPLPAELAQRRPAGRAQAS
ncbi:MAG TPA: hypothetical protein VFD04_11630 [Actinomycetes bacterium]|nr:hypothetical protein [Actinomycetes bacterium]